MTAGSQSVAGESSNEGAEDRPEIAVCESCPGRSVFLETGNTDGWIASDTTVELGEFE